MPSRTPAAARKSAWTRLNALIANYNRCRCRFSKEQFEYREEDNSPFSMHIQCVKIQQRGSAQSGMMNILFVSLLISIEK